MSDQNRNDTRKTFNNLYEVLGIEKFEDNPTLIRKAFLKLALKWHPDKNPDRQDIALEKMKMINNAYEILGDPERKESYDFHLNQKSDGIDEELFNYHEYENIDPYFYTFFDILKEILKYDFSDVRKEALKALPDPLGEHLMETLKIMREQTGIKEQVVEYTKGRLLTTEIQYRGEDIEETFFIYTNLRLLVYISSKTVVKRGNTTETTKYFDSDSYLLDGFTDIVIEEEGELDFDYNISLNHNQMPVVEYSSGKEIDNIAFLFKLYVKDMVIYKIPGNFFVQMLVKSGGLWIGFLTSMLIASFINVHKISESGFTSLIPIVTYDNIPVYLFTLLSFSIIFCIQFFRARFLNQYFLGAKKKSDE